MTDTAKQIEIVEPKAAQIVVKNDSGAVLNMIERASRDPSVDIDKFERLVAMNERIEARAAQIAFAQALALAKAEIQPVVKDGKGHNDAKFATMAAIAKAIDPIVSKHGFSYRYRTSQTDRIFVTCVLSHCGGHSEETTLASAADTSGGKNSIQAIGSALTYLERYTLIAALGLATTEADDDGKAAGASAQITDDQVTQIMTELAETSSNLELFLKRFKIEALPDLPASRFKDALAQIDMKRNR